MTPPRWPFTLLALALGTSVVSGQEYTLKLKQADTNETVLVKRKEQFKQEFKLIDAAGNAVQSRKEARTLSLVFRETGFDKATGATQFTSLKRDYQQAERLFDGGKEALPYEGKTVVIDKKDGKYSFRIDGGDLLDGKDAEELQEEFNKSSLRNLNADLVLPKNPVKVGDSWKFDAAPVAKDFNQGGNLTLDETKTSGTGTLLKAYKKNGRQFGVVEFLMNFTVTHLIDLNNGKKTPCREGKLRLKVLVDGCVDGTSETAAIQASFDGEVRADFSANGMKLKLAIVISGTRAESRAGVK